MSNAELLFQPVEERVELGGLELFTTPLQHRDWNEACASQSGREEELGCDHTGKRIYLNGSVIIAETLKVFKSELVVNKNIIELGAGLGTLSALCCHFGARHVVTTDGERSTLSLAKNTKIVASTTTMEEPASSRPQFNQQFEELLWGDIEKLAALGFLASFDLVIGSELMYFATPVDKLVLTCANLLRKRDVADFSSFYPPMIILAHTFRTESLPADLIRVASENNLAVLELPLELLAKTGGIGVAEALKSVSAHTRCEILIREGDFSAFQEQALAGSIPGTAAANLLCSARTFEAVLREEKEEEELEESRILDILGAEEDLFS